ncbi:MAG: hypothetical protein FD183_89 [Chitinophagaceae bacterium]|nr:MAG: hypothetical protein FD183_89 [Chitinophagaceae bacterium]
MKFYFNTSKFVFTLVGFLLLHACKTTQLNNDRVVASIGQLKLLDIYEIPYNLQYKQTTVGGLSSIDYNKALDEYYFICDDRSNINPARYYTAKIAIKDTHIDTVLFTDVQILKRPDGTNYPNHNSNPKHSTDPESLRYNVIAKNWVWTSEGENAIKGKDTILVDPTITIMDQTGKMLDTFYLPRNLRMTRNNIGPRQNGVIEGMSFGEDYKKLFISLEEPLHEDGPRVDVVDNNTWLRFYQFDVKTKKNTIQYAYKPDPIVYPANPINAFKVNGIPEILNIGNDQFIVVERAYSTGRQKCTVKLFLADARSASDVKDIFSLQSGASFTPMKKTLLLNMDDLPQFIDNVEGITLGPILPNGHRTIILVADNNFSALEESQVFLLEIIP